ncbi:MAG: hypothetical protein JEZ06_11565 [Anaerolineaceae bacterium]|nr:hypothetical protein [Anaerolineaceae bacterium]
MDHVFIYSWPNNKDVEARAKIFYDVLTNGLKGKHKFPFRKPFQIALVKTMNNAFFVAILVKRNATTDVSGQTAGMLQKWIENCRGHYDTIAKIPFHGNDIQTSLKTVRRGDRVIKAIGNIKKLPPPEKQKK